jgi:hypothetical protein
LVCRDDALELYKCDLLNTFSRFHFSLDADMETYFALVLGPRPPPRPPRCRPSGCRVPALETAIGTRSRPVPYCEHGRICRYPNYRAPWRR